MQNETLFFCVRVGTKNKLQTIAGVARHAYLGEKGSIIF